MKKAKPITWLPPACLAVVWVAGCDRPTSAPQPAEATGAPAATTGAGGPGGGSAVAAGASAGGPAGGAAGASAGGPVGASSDAAASASGRAAGAEGGEALSFDDDATGGPAAAFEGVVGDWYVAEEAGGRGLKVDGSKWRNGTPSANLADQAKRLYGERYAEFLDGVKAFAFYPLAVRKGEALPPGDLRLSVRFYPIAGKIDQAAGIAFGIAPDGSYLGARANALEDNLLVFQVVRGKRTVFDTVRGVSTPTRAWHTLAVELRGKRVRVELDGKTRLEKDYEALRPGRVGLWSKADSQVLFDDFKVTRL